MIVFGPKGKETGFVSGSGGRPAWTHDRKEAEEIAGVQKDGRVVDAEEWLLSYNRKVARHNAKTSKPKAAQSA